ncbi:MAG: TonB-dependent receptor [Bacteroidia bacterium]|nr:TonB-dependent receptor [Bacteroidia bacterium]
MNLRYFFFLLSFCLLFSHAAAQTSVLQGHVSFTGTERGPAHIYIPALQRGTSSDTSGFYRMNGLPEGAYQLEVSALGYKRVFRQLYVEAGKVTTADILLAGDSTMLSIVRIVERNDHRLPDVQNVAIYAGKKHEVIQLDGVQGNLAANTARQIFAKVPGIHIQENDGGGIQMSIATRGLNPGRMAEFNVRQNGYDIAADALGYPESYYTPPAFVLQRIEVIRGAASLQYGPQFGGMINFVMKKYTEKPVQAELQATLGSFGFMALNAAVGGHKGKFSYLAYAGKRRGDGWRAHTGFDISNGYAALEWQVSQKVRMGLEYTGMQYNMQQPGGLSDALFAKDPRASYRDRNWFAASWNIIAHTLDYEITPRSRLNVRTFAVIAGRSSVGNLDAVTQPDTGGYRNLLTDRYLNLGSEIRFLQEYKIRKVQSRFLTGVRIYHGHTRRTQGLGSDASDADYRFKTPDDPEDSDFRFPSWNAAWFAENIWYLTSRFSLTPGVRVEFIQTRSDGFYKTNGVRTDEQRNSSRAFALGGVSMAYKTSYTTQLYASFAQNYSPVNFNDIRVNNPNLRVDSALHDVKGFNADLGFRGTFRNILRFDISAYYLAYNGRIGTVTRYDADLNIYQFRTNVANSRNIGAEAFAELNILPIFRCRERCGVLSLFASAAYTNARYTRSGNKSLEGKRVELAPEWILRNGISYRIRGFSMQFQYTYTSLQYTDANNTLSSADGITGIIPAYHLGDLSAAYDFGKFRISAGCNNLFNARYFTRRASGYPGPGILPSDPRNYYVTLGIKL